MNHPMNKLLFAALIVNVTAFVPATIYNTPSDKEFTLQELSICLVEKPVTELLQGCNEDDYQCMTNVVKNVC